MVIIDLDEAIRNFDSLVAQVEEKGELIRICREGKAVADLGPISPEKDPVGKSPELTAKTLEK